MPSPLLRPLTPATEAYQQEQQAMAPVNQQAAEMDTIAQAQASEQAFAKQVQGQAAEAERVQRKQIAEQKAQESRQKEMLANAKRAGVKTTFDGGGQEQPVLHPDGQPVFEHGFQGDVQPGDNGHTVDYRDPRGRVYKVPTKAIRSTQDPAGNPLYEFNIKKEDGTTDTIRQPVGSKPLWNTDPKTGDMYTGAPDPETGSYGQTKIGVDTTVAGKAALARQKELFDQQQAERKFQSDSLMLDQNVRETNLAPVKKQLSEAQAAAKKLEKSKLKYRDDPEKGLMAVQDWGNGQVGETKIDPATNPDDIIKAKAWIEQKAATDKALADAKAAHDPLAAEVQTMQQKRDQLAIEALNHSRSAQVQMMQMEKAQKAGLPVHEPDWQKRIAAARTDPRITSIFSQAELDQMGGPLAEDAKRVSLPETTKLMQRAFTPDFNLDGTLTEDPTAAPAVPMQRPEASLSNHISDRLAVGNVAQKSAYGYPIKSAKELGLDDYFKQHPEVAGMAWGGGENDSGKDEPRVIVPNEYNKYMSDPVKREGLAKIEAARHKMTEVGYNPSFAITPEQQQWRKGLGAYAQNDKAFKQSIVSRLLAHDDVPGVTAQQQSDAQEFERKYLPSTSATDVKSLTTRALGITNPEQWQVSPSQGISGELGYHTLTHNGEDIGEFSTRENRFVLNPPSSSDMDRQQQRLINTSSDGLPVYFASDTPPLPKAAVSDMIRQGVDISRSSTDRAAVESKLAEAKLSPADLRQKVMNGELSVQDGRLLNETFHGITDIDTSKEAVHQGFGKWLNDPQTGVVNGAQFRNGDDKAKQEVINRYFDQLSDVANDNIVPHSRQELASIRSEMLKPYAGPDFLGSGMGAGAMAKKTVVQMPPLIARGIYDLFGLSTAAKWVGLDTEADRLAWEQAKNENSRRTGFINRMWMNSAVKSSLEDLKPWADKANPGDEVPAEIAQRIESIYRDEFHRLDPEAAKTLDPSGDTFDVNKDPMLKAIIQRYLITSDPNTWSSLHSVLASDAKDRVTQKALMEYDDRPIITSVDDVVKRGKGLNLDLNPAKAGEIMALGKELEAAQDPKKAVNIITRAGGILGLTPQNAQLALGLLTRTENEDPNKVSSLWRSGWRSSTNEAAIEMLSTGIELGVGAFLAPETAGASLAAGVASKGARMGIKGAFKNAYRATIGAALRAGTERSATFAAARANFAAGRRSLGTAVSKAGGAYARAGIVQPTLGTPLTIAQKSRNIAVTAAKMVPAITLPEMGEEMASETGSNDPSLASMGQAAAGGAYGALILSPFFTAYGNARQGYAAHRAAKDFTAEKIKWADSINQAMAGKPDFKPYSPADYDIVASIAGNPAHQTALQDHAAALEELGAATQEHTQNVISSPDTRRQQIQARLSELEDQHGPRSEVTMGKDGLPTNRKDSRINTTEEGLLLKELESIDAEHPSSGPLPPSPRLLAAQANAQRTAANVEGLSSIAFSATDELRALPDDQRPLYTGIAKAVSGATDYTEAEGKALIGLGGQSAIAFQQAQSLPADVAGPANVTQLPGAPTVTPTGIGSYRLPAGVRIQVPPQAIAALQERAPSLSGLIGGQMPAPKQSVTTPTATTQNIPQQNAGQQTAAPLPRNPALAGVSDEALAQRHALAVELSNRPGQADAATYAQDAAVMAKEIEARKAQPAAQPSTPVNRLTPALETRLKQHGLTVSYTPEEQAEVNQKWGPQSPFNTPPAFVRGGKGTAVAMPKDAAMDDTPIAENEVLSAVQNVVEKELRKRNTIAGRPLIVTSHYQAHDGGADYNYSNDTVRVNPLRLAVSIWADRSTNPTRAEVARAAELVIDHEVVHAAQMQAAKDTFAKLPIAQGNFKKLPPAEQHKVFMGWVDSHYGDMWRTDLKDVHDATMKIYGSVLEGRPDWHKAFEALRMIVQERTAGSTSESATFLTDRLREHLKAALAVLKRWYADVMAGVADKPVIKAEIEAIEALLAKKSPQTAENGAKTPKSSTQLTLSAKDAAPILAFGESIPKDELYDSLDPEWSDGALETEPHVTVLFGLTKHEAAPVAAAIADHGPVTVTLGKMSIFENDEFDVLKIDVESPELRALNAKLSKLPNENSYPDYKPHMTIAYLKKGEGKKYVGDARFEGKQITFDTMTFSPPSELRGELGTPELPLVKGMEIPPGNIKETAPSLNFNVPLTKRGQVRQSVFPDAESLAAFQFKLDLDTAASAKSTPEESSTAKQRGIALLAKMMEDSPLTRPELEKKLLEYHADVVTQAEGTSALDTFTPPAFHTYAKTDELASKSLPPPAGGDIISGMQAQGIRRIGPPTNSADWSWYRELEADVANSKLKPGEAQRLARAGDVSDARARLGWINENVVSRKSGRPIDEAAAELNASADQAFPVESGDQLGRAIMEALDSRAKAKQGGSTPETAQEQQAKDAAASFATLAAGAEGQPFTASQLSRSLENGDEIKIGGEIFTVSEVDPIDEYVRMESDRFGPVEITGEDKVNLNEGPDHLRIGKAPPVTHTMPDGYVLTEEGMNAIGSAPTRAYHGTPHKVDKFSTDKIGTGEGAQAYGWGLYFAQSEAVGAEYRDKLAQWSLLTSDGKIYDDRRELKNLNVRAVLNKDGSIDDAIARARSVIDSIPGTQGAELALTDIATLEKLKANGGLTKTTGNLYTVDLLPNEEEFLDWDLPLSEQSDKVKAALLQTGLWTERNMDPKTANPLHSGAFVYEVQSGNENPNGIGGNEKAASLKLLSLGIPGIKYLDGNSRSNGQGTYNYVLFDENLVRIIAENGNPVESLASAPSQPRAQAGGEIGPNGEFYSGGAFIATKNLPKKIRDRIAKAAKSGEQIEPGYGRDKIAEIPAGKLPIVARLVGSFLGPDGSINQEYIDRSGISPSHVAQIEAASNLYKQGERLLDVQRFPLLANFTDAARLMESGMEVPTELIGKMPSDIADIIRKQQEQLASAPSRYQSPSSMLAATQAQMQGAEGSKPAGLNSMFNPKPRIPATGERTLFQMPNKGAEIDIPAWKTQDGRTWQTEREAKATGLPYYNIEPEDGTPDERSSLELANYQRGKVIDLEPSNADIELARKIVANLNLVKEKRALLPDEQAAYDKATADIAAQETLASAPSQGTPTDLADAISAIESNAEDPSDADYWPENIAEAFANSPMQQGIENNDFATFYEGIPESLRTTQFKKWAEDSKAAETSDEDVNLDDAEAFLESDKAAKMAKAPFLPQVAERVASTIAQIEATGRHKWNAKTKTFDELDEPQVLYSAPSRVTPDQDAEYMAAVESGDVAKQQAMVDAAAKAAAESLGLNVFGTSIPLYHGGAVPFTEVGWNLKSADRTFNNRPDTRKIFWLSSNKDASSLFALMAESKLAGKDPLDAIPSRIKPDDLIQGIREKSIHLPVRRLFILAKKIRKIETNSPYPPPTGPQVLKEIQGALKSSKEKGYDGVVFHNLTDFLPQERVYAVFPTAKIKSADPITRDAGGKVVPLSQRFNADSDSILYSAPSRVTPEQDAAYLAAVESGDVAKQQAMVDAAARRAGYAVGPVWHRGAEWNAADFNLIDQGQQLGLHLGTKGQISNIAKSWLGVPRLDRSFYVAAQNPLRLEDFGIWNWEFLKPQLKSAGIFISPELDSQMALMEQRGGKDNNVKINNVLRDVILSAGYDSVVYLNRTEGVSHTRMESDPRLPRSGRTRRSYTDELLRDYGAEDSYIVFDPNQIKSADPVTRDAEGNVIPLSQRFNSNSDSILYSAPTESAPAQATPDNEAQVREIIASMPKVWQDVLKDFNAGKSVEDIAKDRLYTPEQTAHILSLAQGRFDYLRGALPTKPKVAPVKGGEPLFKGGRPDLAYGSIPAFAAVDQNRGTPEQVTHAEMQEAATRMFAIDPAAAEKLVTRWMDGGGMAFSVEDMPDGIKAIVADAQTRKASMALMTAAAQIFTVENAFAGGSSAKSARLIDLYRNSGEEFARALSQRRDVFETPAERNAWFLSEVLLTPPPSIRSEMKRNPANKAKILADWAARADQIKKELLAEGIDIDATMKQMAKERELAAATIPEAIKPALAQAPKSVRQAVKTILEGGTWQDAINASGLGHKTAQKAYNAFRGLRNIGSKIAAGIRETLGSAPSENFTELPEWTDDVNLKSAPINTPQTKALAIHRNRKMEGEIDLKNDLSVNKTRQAMALRKASGFDKLMEYWKSSILSGPLSAIVNVSSGLGFGAYRVLFKKLSASVQADIVRLFGFHPDAPSLRDFPAMLSAVIPSLQSAGTDMLRSWNNETQFFDRFATDDGLFAGTSSDGEQFDPAIKGIFGKIMRGISFRHMTAADEFVKSFLTRIEVGAQALQIARNEGKTGEALATAMKDLMRPGSLAWERALSGAKVATFQSQEVRGNKLDSDIGSGERAIDVLDNLARILGKAKKGDFGSTVKVASHFLFPFVGTPTNIFKTGITMSPAGGLLALIDASRAVARSRKGNHQEAAKIYNAARAFDDITNQIVCWGVMLGIASLVKPGDDGEPPMITGSTEGDPSSGERELTYRAAPPYSIRLWGKWYSYKRLDPLGTALAFCVDSVREFQKGKPIDKVWAKIGTGMLATMQDKTFMKSISDISNVLHDPERYGTQWIAGIATGFVPNLIRQPARATDHVVRETDFPNDMPFAESFARRIGFGMYPSPSNPLAPLPAVDAFGRESAKNTGTGQPGTDIMLRLISPLESLDATNVDPLDKKFLRYNMTHDKGFSFTAPPREITRTIGGKEIKISLSDEEYLPYEKSSGQAFYGAMNTIYGSKTADYSEQDHDDIVHLRTKVIKPFTDEAFSKALRKRQADGTLKP